MLEGRYGAAGLLALLCKGGAVFHHESAFGGQRERRPEGCRSPRWSRRVTRRPALRLPCTIPTAPPCPARATTAQRKAQA
jgi:hypothetical protein